MLICKLPAEHYDWDRLRRGVEAALVGATKQETLSFDSVKHDIEKGTLIWCVVDHDGEIVADIFCTVSDDNDKRVMNFPLMFGKDSAQWADVAESTFLEHARANGCQAMRLACYGDHRARLYRQIFPKWTHYHVFEIEA